MPGVFLFHYIVGPGGSLPLGLGFEAWQGSSSKEFSIKEVVGGRRLLTWIMKGQSFVLWRWPGPPTRQRYMPSYSTRLKYESETWSVLPPNSSDPMGAADPIWTESNWNIISLRVYTVQSATYDHLILAAGIAVTALSYVIVMIIKAFIAKALKQD